jgi:hypothetical protein
MVEKESEESSVDYGFMNKYLRNESDNSKKENKESFLPVKFGASKSGATEVFGNVGEGESYSENNNFNNGFKKRYNKEDDGPKIFEEKSKVTPSIVSAERQKFLKQLEDESLSIDTAGQINHDWKK